MPRVVSRAGVRDLSVRYKQTVIGVTWTVIRPSLTIIVVFTVIFGRIAKLPTERRPLPDESSPACCRGRFLQLVSARRPTERQSDQQGLFPAGDRADLSGSRRLCRFPDHLCDGGRLDGMVPVLAGLANAGSARLRYISLRGSMGPALWITAPNVKHRDFRYVILFIVQFGLYVSPVGLSSIVVPKMAAALFDESDGGRHRWFSSLAFSFGSASRGSATQRKALPT
jgi:lipopolysaccharide transport system permease protein